MTAADQIVQTAKKVLAMGPFSNRVSLVNGFVAAPGHGSLRGRIIRRNIWSEAQVQQFAQRADVQ